MRIRCTPTTQAEKAGVCPYVIFACAAAGLIAGSSPWGSAGSTPWATLQIFLQGSIPIWGGRLILTLSFGPFEQDTFYYNVNFPEMHAWPVVWIDAINLERTANCDAIEDVINRLGCVAYEHISQSCLGSDASGLRALCEFTPMIIQFTTMAYVLCYVSAGLRILQTCGVLNRRWETEQAHHHLNPKP